MPRSPALLGLRSGPASVLGAATVWGTSGFAAAVVPQVDPLTVGALTLAISGVVLASTAIRGIRTVAAAPGAWGPLTVAASALALYILAFFSGMAWAGVTIGTIVAIASAPVFVGVLEAMIRRRRPGARWLLATGITVLGGVLLVVGRVDDSSGAGSSLTAGVASALVAGASYAVFTYATSRLIVPTARRPQGLAERPVIALVQGLTVAPLLVVAACAGLPGAGDASAWLALLYIGLLPTALGYLLYARGLRTTSASAAALLTLFEPVVAAILAVAFLSEALTALGWIGMAVAVAGLGIVAVSPTLDTPGSGKDRAPLPDLRRE